MLCTGYSEGQPLGPGIRLTIAGEPTTGDDLVIEYPNNSRATAKIVTVSSRTMDIALGDKTWHLIPESQQESGKKFHRV
jgi:hypothetical protein